MKCDKCKRKSLKKGHKCGKDSSRWRGGKRTDTNGYVCLYMPGHHRAYANGYVFEHIVKMEKKLGRRLKKNEYVGRKSKGKEGRSDNRLSNLVLKERKKKR